MKILKTNVENLENEVLLLYKLTRGGKSTKSVSKLDDEELDIIYPVDAYCQYEDVNSKGETIVLLSILSGEHVFSAQSATLQRSFFDIVELVKDRGFAIKFADGKTKSDRRYVDCELAEVY